jgi:hypothetical protein
MLEVPAPGGAGETVRALDVWCSLDLYLDLEMPARAAGLAPGEPIPVAWREYPDAKPSELARVTMSEWVTEALRERLQVSEPAAFIRESFEADPSRSWSDVIDEEHRWRTSEADEEITELVREAIEQRVEEEK